MRHGAGRLPKASRIPSLIPSCHKARSRGSVGRRCPPLGCAFLGHRCSPPAASISALHRRSQEQNGSMLGSQTKHRAAFAPPNHRLTRMSSTGGCCAFPSTMGFPAVPQHGTLQLHSSHPSFLPCSSPTWDFVPRAELQTSCSHPPKGTSRNPNPVQEQHEAELNSLFTLKHGFKFSVTKSSGATASRGNASGPL